MKYSLIFGDPGEEQKPLLYGQGAKRRPASTLNNHKVIEGTWRLKIPRKSICEHPRPLENPTDDESKSASRLCVASPQFTSVPLISANIQISH